MVAAGITIGSLIAVGLHVHAQTRYPSAGDMGVIYQVTSVVTEKAMNPMPGQNAKDQSQQSTVGKGKAMVKTSKDNTYWVEEVDFDGSGTPVEAQMLWDESDKVLYTYADKPFQCKDGSSPNGGFMIATYGQGNRAKRPAGSGWWLASLDQGMCKASNEGLFGCKFDENGKNIACGLASLNEKTNDLMIMEPATTTVR
jgi:hypothetical protein